MVRVFTKHHCVQCKFTKKKLDAFGISYEEINLDDNPEAIEHVKELGFKSAPIVETDSETWSGFQPDKLEMLKRCEEA